MTRIKKIKENNYDTAQAGITGAINYAVGWGTPASPNVSQTPDSFVKSRSLGSNSNTAANAPSAGSQHDNEIDQIYDKKDTPSPDEVVTGLKYELQNMTKKDKGLAKEIVLGNLKKDPHYYGKLKMLNIDDKEMMDMPTSQTPEEKMNETIRVLNRMIESKGKKSEPSRAIKEALQDTRNRKNERYKKS